MNVLFLANNALDPYSGGIERTTYNLLSYMSQDEELNLVAAFTKIPRAIEGVKCIEITVTTGHEIAKIIEENKIDIAVFPGGPWYVKLLKNAVPNISCKIVTCLHSPPKVAKSIYIPYVVQEFLRTGPLEKIFKFPKFIADIVRFPLLVEKDRHNYNFAYKNSSAFVLLSSSYFKPFKQFSRLKDGSKLHAIGNALSFDYIANEEDLITKKDSVLTVARLDELSKRISFMLRSWKNIQKGKWIFDIVGFGSDEKVYKDFVKENNISNVFFHGKQIPNEYYLKAKIFLMTSKFEGWGMTLTEAIQSGCVPIVMDSFGALHEIIIHNYNGIIIKNDDVESFSYELEKLMSDPERLFKMSKNALASSQQFTLEKITLKWKVLFKTIMN